MEASATVEEVNPSASALEYLDDEQLLSTAEVAYVHEKAKDEKAASENTKPHSRSLSKRRGTVSAQDVQDANSVDGIDPRFVTNTGSHHWRHHVSEDGNLSGHSESSVAKSQSDVSAGNGANKSFFACINSKFDEMLDVKLKGEGLTREDLNSRTRNGNTQRAPGPANACRAVGRPQIIQTDKNVVDTLNDALGLLGVPTQQTAQQVRNRGPNQPQNARLPPSLGQAMDTAANGSMANDSMTGESIPVRLMIPGVPRKEKQVKTLSI